MATTLSNDDLRFLKKLGLRIRSLRNEKGWTLEDVESHGWNGWQHLQKIESGKNITVVTLRKVAKLYRITISQLLEGC
ncbi:MAG: helix-turn-helix transcriptional regulator [Xanthomonadaceae bacterium]|nr:helix-turn-helix transcriptional regulator [Xanthomonadaceae bacterium]